jgi:type IV pilus assembly protein PilB
MPVPKKLGEILVEEGLITADHLNQALERQKETGRQLGAILIEMGFLKKEELLTCLKERFGISSANLDSVSFIEPTLLKLIPRDTAEKYVAIPLELKNRKLVVAMADPLNMADIDDIQFRTGYSTMPVFAFESDIRKAINKFYGQSEKQTPEVGKLSGGTVSDLENERIYGETHEIEGTSSTEEEIEVISLMDLDSPINKFLHGIFNTAVQNHVDEIHMEFYPDGGRVRYRMDNVLYEVLGSSRPAKSALLNRLKRLLGLEALVKSDFQKKYVKLKLGDQSPLLDLSVFSCPLGGGEKILFKLKNRSSPLNLDQLGLEASTVKNLQETLRKPTGCTLVTGPIRSGKMTTLYTLLCQATPPELNKMTLEDATAYSLKGVNQIMVSPEEGFSYLTGLQFIKAHLPDLIMIDTLRDPELADKAFDLAAETRLMSSLGALDTTQAIMRLLTYLSAAKLANNLNCVIAQRLVRKICGNCKERILLSESNMERLGFTPQDTCYTGKGCASCGYTGYQGVTGIFEVLWCSDNIRRLIINECSAEELKTAAIQEGMSTLRKSGLEKVKQGITTLNEVIRSTLRSAV